MRYLLIIALLAIAYLVIVHPTNLNLTQQSGYNSNTLQNEAYQDALSVGINPNYFVRQINQESGFNPQAYNARSQASGIAQFIPSTAASWGLDPWDPHASLITAARYMKHYQDLYGSYRAALIAYNCGPACVGKPLPAETVNYINVIMG